MAKIYDPWMSTRSWRSGTPSATSIWRSATSSPTSLTTSSAVFKRSNLTSQTGWGMRRTTTSPGAPGVRGASRGLRGEWLPHGRCDRDRRGYSIRHGRGRGRAANRRAAGRSTGAAGRHRLVHGDVPEGHDPLPPGRDPVRESPRGLHGTRGRAAPRDSAHDLEPGHDGPGRRIQCPLARLPLYYLHLYLVYHRGGRGVRRRAGRDARLLPERAAPVS